MLEYWKNQHTARGFNPGGMFVKDNFCYIPIPKNSSSYIGHVLLKNGWGVGNFLTTDLTDKNIIVLIREPVDRWTSGMAQYMSSALLINGRGPDDIINGFNDVTQDLIFDRIIFDDHTEKQSYFIQSVPKTNCIFLNSSNSPEQAIKNYLSKFDLDLNIDIDVDRNQSQGVEYKEKLVNFLKDYLLANPELTDKLKNTYKEDYKIWNVTT